MKPHHGDPDQALDCFAQCARGVRDASQVCRVPGRLPRPRQRPAQGVRDASQVCRYQADFPGLGRGLRSLKQVLDWPSFTEIEFITT